MVTLETVGTFRLLTRRKHLFECAEIRVERWESVIDQRSISPERRQGRVVSKLIETKTVATVNG